MRRRYLLVAILGLSACVGGIAPNAVSIDNDGGGKFSGYAGPDWSEPELRRMVGTQVCGGPAPASFSRSILDGNSVFSGTC
jgi:hypothetical protein